MQKDDYVIYGSVVEQLLAHKEKILLAKPKEFKPFGISGQTLFNARRALLAGKTAVLEDKTVKSLLAYIISV